MLAPKRDPDANRDMQIVDAKRQRMDLVAIEGETDDQKKQIQVTKEGIRRTSRLEAPIMLLAGHQGALYTMEFSPSGENVASGSHDKDIFLWRVYGECQNYLVLRGHKNAVLDLHWSVDGTRILSCSADNTVRAWDTDSGQQVKKLTEHTAAVNSCCPARRGPPLAVSGSDDGSTKVWDLRLKKSVQSLPDKFQITAVAFSDASDKVYTGGIDNEIKVWDLRKAEVTLRLPGHMDTITGMRLSPDGSYLLTNSMDQTLRVWDMRPYAPAQRCIKVFAGHQHGYEKYLLKCDWSPDGSKVAAGGSDHMVYIWDTASRRLVYRLPGHKGATTQVAFHPKEPIIGSCSIDRTVYLGEIDPSAR